MSTRMRGASQVLAVLLAATFWVQPIVAHEPDPSTAASTVGLRQAQGGLVDVRYGQVALDTGGRANVFELIESSKLLLDGRPVTAQELLEAIPVGLSAVATFGGSAGTLERLEAFSSGASQPKAAVGLIPARAPAYRKGELLTVVMTTAESARLGPGPLVLVLPGVGQARFGPAQRGGSKAMLRLQPEDNLVDVPIFVQRGDAVFRGPTISVAAKPPDLTSYGPQTASSKLETLTGWVDVSHPSQLLDLSSARLRASPGLQLKSFQPRVGRSVFEAQADGPGLYWLEFEISDLFGYKIRQRWDLNLLP